MRAEAVINFEFKIIGIMFVTDLACELQTDPFTINLSSNNSFKHTWKSFPLQSVDDLLYFREMKELSLKLHRLKNFLIEKIT